MEQTGKWSELAFDKAKQGGDGTNKSLLDSMPWLNPANFDSYSGGNIGLHHASMRGRYMTQTGDVQGRGQQKLHAWQGDAAATGTMGAGGRTVVDQSIPTEGRALLDTLASGEAPDYNVLNGGGRFSSFDDHPDAGGHRAAGRYQFLPSTWKGIQQQTGLGDFSPKNQDQGAGFSPSATTRPIPVATFRPI